MPDPRIQDGEGREAAVCANCGERLIVSEFGWPYWYCFNRGCLLWLVAQSAQPALTAPPPAAPGEARERPLTYDELTDAYQRQLDHTNFLRETYLDRIAALESRLATADAELDRLVSALTFYATPANWRSPSTGFAIQYDPEPSPIDRDRGDRARVAVRAPAPSTRRTP